MVNVYFQPWFLGTTIPGPHLSILGVVFNISVCNAKYLNIDQCNVLKTIMMGYFLHHFLETLKWPFPILVSTLSNLFQRCNEFIGQGVEPPQFHPHQLSRKMQRIHATCTKRIQCIRYMHKRTLDTSLRSGLQGYHNEVRV